jgi:hypothetical protein
MSNYCRVPKIIIFLKHREFAHLSQVYGIDAPEFK